MLAQSHALVANPRIERVFLVSRWDYDYLPQALFASRLEKVIAAYGRFGATVYIVKQPPVQTAFDKRAYVRAVVRHRIWGEDLSATIAQQSITLAEHLRTRAFTDAVFASLTQPRVQIIDPAAAL
jgi:hypothetical protein